MRPLPLTQTENELIRKLIEKSWNEFLTEHLRATSNAVAEANGRGNIGLARGLQVKGAIGRLFEHEAIKIRSVAEVLRISGKPWSSSVAESLREDLAASFDAAAGSLLATAVRRSAQDQRCRGEEVRLRHKISTARGTLLRDLDIESLRSRLDAPQPAGDTDSLPALNSAHPRPAGEPTPEDIVDLKPNLFGLGLNLNALWRRIRRKSR